MRDTNKDMTNLLLLIEKSRREGLIKKYFIDTEECPYFISVVDHNNEYHGFTRDKFERYGNELIYHLLYEEFVISTKEDFDKINDNALLKSPHGNYQLKAIKMVYEKSSNYKIKFYSDFRNDSEPFDCPFEDLIGWKVRQHKRVKL